MFTAPRSHSCVNVFLVKAGVDVVIHDDNGRAHRGRAAYDTCETTVSGAKVSVELVKTVDQATGEITVGHIRMAIGKKYDLTLLRQSGDHFFAPLRNDVEKSPRISPEEALKIIEAARKTQ